MRRILFILVIIFYASSTVISSGIESDISKEPSSLFSRELADYLSNNTPLDIIIALDSSTSMINSSTESQKIALNFLRLIGKKEKDNIRIGYVSWSHIPPIIESPTADYNIVRDLINRTIFGGNTCFVVGIDKSVELLNENPSKMVKKAVVFISDGVENCNLSGKYLICPDLNRTKYPGISFYSISTAGNRSGILSCLNDPIEPTSLKNPYGRDIATLSDIPAQPFTLQANGRAIQVKELNTNVIVTKTVEEGNAGPRIVLRIDVPDLPDIKNAIVLALDSSGSFGLGGRPDHGVIVRKAISDVLDKTAEKYPNTNISILSWDDNIDFAYSNLTNKNASNATMVPIEQAVNDIANNHVFIPAEKYIPISIPFINWVFANPFIDILNPDYTEHFYYCLENESTNLSVGLQGAIDILDKNYPNNDIRDTTGKSIVLITGRSEFTDYRSDVIAAEAKKKNYKIYPVGLGVIYKSLLKERLEQIGGGNYQYCPNSLDWTKDAVEADIFKAIEQTMMGTVVNNITIIESLYPYLDVTNIIVKLNGTVILSPFITNPLNTRQGNTWIMRLREGLKPKDTLEIDLETKLSINLPVDVTENSRMVCFIPTVGFVPSSISYNWRDKNIFSIPLPENSIVI